MNKNNESFVCNFKFGEFVLCNNGAGSLLKISPVPGTLRKYSDLIFSNCAGTLLSFYTWENWGLETLCNISSKLYI